MIGEAVVVLRSGTVVGLTLGAAVVRYIGPLLYDARAGDASTLATPGVIMIAVSILAALPPVVRATRVNPIEILRAE